ncbi:hypothetical protein Xph01_04300 [Micromonospora phaseoli]|nr:hypothetical protein Xph01_04300 [Micromonospora phaseoli]
MGARGRAVEFPIRLPLHMSEAQQYRLQAIALDRELSLAGAMRYLIDNYGRDYEENQGQSNKADPGGRRAQATEPRQG